MAKNNTATITTRVAVVEEQVDRFEVAIEKLVEVSQSLKEIIAVQSQQIQESKASQNLLREQIDKETTILHKRIRDLDKEFAEELENQHKEVMRVLTEMRLEQKEHHTSMAESVDKITKEIKDETDREIKDLTKKIDSLQKWRWFVVGGATALGFIISLIVDLSKHM
jgi:ATP-dependent exoDNAse (exonuclease V) beta subunit